MLSERMRGHRAGVGISAFASVPAGTKQRSVYDTHDSMRLPGTLVRSEANPPSSDETVNEAFDSAGTTYDFYKTVLNRNSVDNRGLRLDSTVHYARKFNNAFWNGRQMVYGDGDGKLFVGFAGALDVVAHELTHGMTQYTVPGGLDYENQSGALNESISDVFGSVVKQWKNNQSVTEADWLIGAGILAPAEGKALRSMKDPGDTSITWSGDDQPKDMSGYVDGGDVHTNSGIPNHAFYLAATNLGGYSWDKAAKIWYRALPLLSSTATFAEAAQATIHAVTLLGLGSAEERAVQSAWKAVQVI
jgi:Zn-dependent metalloprotease